MSYYEELGRSFFTACKEPYTNAEMEMFGRTGQKPEYACSFSEAMKDPVKKKIYEAARKAALATAQAKATKAEASAQTQIRTAQQQQAADIAAASRTPMTTWLLIGGGLAAFAGFMVFKKKKSA